MINFLFYLRKSSEVGVLVYFNLVGLILIVYKYSRIFSVSCDRRTQYSCLMKTQWHYDFLIYFHSDLYSVAMFWRYTDFMLVNFFLINLCVLASVSSFWFTPFCLACNCIVNILVISYLCWLFYLARINVLFNQWHYRVQHSLL